MWEAAQATDEAKRSFKNGVLGLTWVETGEAPDWQRLYERRESWQIGTVPSGGLFLTAGADVQKDRIEVDVWAWGRGLESWPVDHIVIDGARNAGAWAALTELLGETWPSVRRFPRRSSHRHRLRGAAVYGWAGGWDRPGGAIKGVEDSAAPVVRPTCVDATEGGRKIRRGARLWTVTAATLRARPPVSGCRRRPKTPHLARRLCPPAARHRCRMGQAAGPSSW
jgi:hypothetical protein